MARYNNRQDSWESDSWGASIEPSASSSSSGYARTSGASLDQWAVETQKLTSNLSTIAQNVSDIEKWIQRVGTNEDSDELRQRIKSRVDDTRTRIKSAEESVKVLQRLENSGGSAGENSKRRMVLSKASKEFKLWLGRFKEVGQIWVMKSKTPRSGGSSGASYTTSLGTEHFYQQPPSNFESQPLVPQQQQQYQQRFDSEIQFREYMATERDQEARDIEKGVADLAAIFDDFSAAVDAQQDFIDTIENNVVQAVDNTRQGVQTLQAAKGYQESSRSKLYCVALIAIIILGILVALAAIGVTIKYAF